MFKYNGDMKKAPIYIIVLLLIAWCLLFIVDNSCKKYSCVTFNAIQNFKETEQIESTKISYKGILTNGAIRVRLEVYTAPSQEVADGFTQTKLMQLQGLYENGRSPYPGELSNEILCEERFKPAIKNGLLNGMKVAFVTGYLNDRLQYGSCLESQTPYVGKSALFYCTDQKKWYSFETIAKKSDSSLDKETTYLIQSLKCKKSF